MQKGERTIICGSKLVKSRIVNIDFYLSAGEFIFISGTIYSPYGIPLKNSAITITRVDDRIYPPKKTYLGLTFSDYKGFYGISIMKVPGCSYELRAYCYIG